MIAARPMIRAPCTSEPFRAGFPASTGRSKFIGRAALDKSPPSFRAGGLSDGATFEFAHFSIADRGRLIADGAFMPRAIELSVGLAAGLERGGMMVAIPRLGRPQPGMCVQRIRNVRVGFFLEEDRRLAGVQLDGAAVEPFAGGKDHLFRVGGAGGGQLRIGSERSATNNHGLEDGDGRWTRGIATLEGRKSTTAPPEARGAVSKFENGQCEVLGRQAFGP